MKKKNLFKPTYYCGIRGLHFIWHGDWSPSEVRYKNRVIRTSSIDDYFVPCFEDEHPEIGADPRGYNQAYSAYLKERAWDIKNFVLSYGEKY